MSATNATLFVCRIIGLMLMGIAQLNDHPAPAIMGAALYLGAVFEMRAK